MNFENEVNLKIDEILSQNGKDFELLTEELLKKY